MNSDEQQKQGGSLAAHIGRHTEDRLRLYLTNANFNELTRFQRDMLREAIRQGQDPADFFRHANLDSVFVLRTKMFPSIYATPWVSDAFIYRTMRWNNRGLVVEIKSQEAGGSVDEKLPFAMLTLGALKRPAAILIVGNGFRACALDWAITFGREHNPEIRVFREWRDLQKMILDGHVEDVATTLYAPNPQRTLEL